MTIEWPWKPIETAPAGYADGDEYADPPRLLVWVANGGRNGKGCVAFGRVYRSRRMSDYFSPQAEGFLGDFQITHWMPEPTGPEMASPPAYPTDDR